MSKNLGGFDDQSSSMTMITPVLGVAENGAKRVLEVMSAAVADVGWATGQYLGLAGFTPDINSAEDVRGAAGAAGSNGTNGTNGTNGADGAPGAISLGTAVVGETSLVTLALGVRRVTVAVPGAVTGGNYLAFPTAALGAGYGIVDSICTTNGQITFGILVPILTGSYSITVRVVKIL